MSMLRKEWTDEEMVRLGNDLRTAKVKVLNDWGFSNEEIHRITQIPESVIRRMLNK